MCDGTDRHTTIRHEEYIMNWDQSEGNWKQIKGNAKEQWGKLTNDDLDVVAGKRGHLAGKIQEAYGVTKDDAEKQLSDWQKMQKARNAVRRTWMINPNNKITFYNRKQS